MQRSESVMRGDLAEIMVRGTAGGREERGQESASFVFVTSSPQWPPGRELLLRAGELPQESVSGSRLQGELRVSGTRPVMHGQRWSQAGNLVHRDVCR